MNFRAMQNTKALFRNCQMGALGSILLLFVYALTSPSPGTRKQPIRRHSQPGDGGSTQCPPLTRSGNRS